ncbi:MAG: succinate dehydrogenase [Candidatus Marinimicrobia bacterium]|nr:succinate dehydrogenase [Candidatus Neomarinimicrobiota bacterium]|tara:strand:- start:33680 stop:34366 length:687 start_codon:yes stop_codon:yes gene_type:complete
MNYYFTSNIFRKTLASLSGLFLVTFLFGHLTGNLQLLIPGIKGQTQFNKYAFFMTTNPFVKILSILTYTSIILHVVVTIYLELKSRLARPIGYLVSNNSLNSTWSSRNMPLLGAILLIFIIIHLKSFWYEMHFGKMPYQILSDGTKIKDLHTITVSAFKNPIYTLFYAFSMVVLALHLNHGVLSALQTVGLKTQRFNIVFKYISSVITLFIPALFALIPIYIYIKNFK